MNFITHIWPENLDMALWSFANRKKEAKKPKYTYSPVIMPEQRAISKPILITFLIVIAFVISIIVGPIVYDRYREREYDNSTKQYTDRFGVKKYNFNRLNAPPLNMKEDTDAVINKINIMLSKMSLPSIDLVKNQVHRIEFNIISWKDESLNDYKMTLGSCSYRTPRGYEYKEKYSCVQGVRIEPYDYKTKQTISELEQRLKEINKGTYTVAGKISCLSKEWLDDAYAFLAANDHDSVKAYLQAQKCVVFEEGTKVTLVKRIGSFGTLLLGGGYTCFAYKGIKLYTTNNALKER